MFFSIALRELQDFYSGCGGLAYGSYSVWVGYSVQQNCTQLLVKVRATCKLLIYYIAYQLHFQYQRLLVHFPYSVHYQTYCDDYMCSTPTPCTTIHSSTIISAARLLFALPYNAYVSLVAALTIACSYKLPGMEARLSVNPLWKSLCIILVLRCDSSQGCDGCFVLVLVIRIFIAQQMLLRIRGPGTNQPSWPPRRNCRWSTSSPLLVNVETGTPASAQVSSRPLHPASVSIVHVTLRLLATFFSRSSNGWRTGKCEGSLTL
jgi:hypothetical protein